MAKYVLLTGTHQGFTAEGERKLFKAGDVVELNADQAKAFGDKFKSYDEWKVAKAAEEAAFKAAKEAEEKEAKKNAKEQAKAKATAEEEEEEEDEGDEGKDAAKGANAGKTGTAPAANGKATGTKAA